MSEIERDRTAICVQRTVARVYELKADKLRATLEDVQSLLLAKTGSIETVVEVTPGLKPLSPRLRTPIEQIQAAAKAENFVQALILLRNLSVSLGVTL